MPPIAQSAAQGHGDPIVRELIFVMERLYYRRGALDLQLLNDMGDIVFPAFPELLIRPPKKKKKPDDDQPSPADHPDDPDDFNRRRSDRMEGIIRVIIAQACCCDWTNMEIKDPKGGYLSVWRLAELADLPSHLVAPEWDDDEGSTRRRQDTVERILQALRHARIVVYTKQHREQLDDGRYTITAPAKRKMSVHFFRKFGGALSKTFDWRRATLKKKKQDKEQKDFTKGVGVDMRTAEEIGKLAKNQGTTPPAPPPAEPPRRAQKIDEMHTPEDLIDQVHEEHPDWSFPDVLALARRRFLERGPPKRSSREPTKPN